MSTPDVDIPRQISEVLSVADIENHTARAKAAGVTVHRLPLYMDKLEALGLVDNNRRVTRAGRAYALIAANGTGKGVNEIAIWRHIGGERPQLDEALRLLEAHGLIEKGEVRTPANVDPAVREMWERRERLEGTPAPEVTEGNPEPGWIATSYELPQD